MRHISIVHIPIVLPVYTKDCLFLLCLQPPFPFCSSILFSLFSFQPLPTTEVQSQCHIVEVFLMAESHFLLPICLSFLLLYNRLAKIQWLKMTVLQDISQFCFDQVILLMGFGELTVLFIFDIHSFDCHNQMEVIYHGQRPGMLVNMLQCMGELPTTINYLAQNVYSADVENFVISIFICSIFFNLYNSPMRQVRSSLFTKEKSEAQMC